MLVGLSLGGGVAIRLFGRPRNEPLRGMAGGTLIDIISQHAYVGLSQYPR